MKIQCNDCHRKIVDTPAAKMDHVMKYHPEVPLIRIATSLFSPIIFEEFGKRMGNRLLRIVNRG